MERTPKVSVIIPVYNVEDYLCKCLDSLINQTLKSIEIICVDDGSTDRSLEVLKKYAIKDERVFVIQQKNNHAGVARNRGLEIARGEYVIFLDSDDYFEEELLWDAYSSAIETKADVVLFDAQKFDSQTGEHNTEYHYLKQQFLPQERVFSYKNIPDKILQISTPAPWNKLFKRSFVIRHGLQFQSLINSNDLYFVYLAICLAERLAIVNKPLIHYRVNTKRSLQDSKDKNPLCFIEAYKALHASLVENNIWEEVKKSFANAVVSTAVFNLESLTDSEARYSVEKELFATEFRSTGYMNLKMDEYDYPEKYYQLHCALTKYTTRRLAEYAGVLERKEHVPAVSVIIPVYNMEHWLNQSIESISKQTLREIEIICVNDGSTDHSLEILELWAERDPRIKLVSQPNGGLSAARNFGLKHAQGEYIYFFDSDDLLKPHALEYIYNEACKNQLEVLLFDAETLFEDESLRKENERFNNHYIRDKAYDQVMTGEEMYTIMRKNNAYRCSVPLQLVKRRFLEKIGLTFKNGIIHEDELYTVKLLLQAHRVSHRNEPLFIRRVRNNSIMTAAQSFMNCYSFFQITAALIEWMEKDKIEINKNTEYVLEGWILYLIKKTRKMWKEVSGKQKRCLSAMPISERILFKSWVEQGMQSQYQLSQQKDGIYPEPVGIGKIIKRVGRIVIPKEMRTFIKKQSLRIPHKTKVKIKKMIRW